MRIAYLTQSYPPMISGAAISAQKTAEAMTRLGHQVLVIAASDREYPYHSYKDNIAVLRLSSYKNPFRVGQRLMLYPHRNIMKFLRQFKPDIIHTHDPLQIGILAIEYARRTRIPVTLTIHQLPWFAASYLPKSFKPFIERFLWMYARMALKWYTSLIAPTQTIANIIETKTELKPDVISYGLDLQTFHPHLFSDPEPATRKKLNLPPDIPIIIHVGRLDKDKSVDMVIRAAVPAIRKSEAHLLIVGDGCQMGNLTRLCKELGIGRRVHFTGFLPQSELPEIYRIADVFVTASEIETQGIVLLEAAASGLPIVAVNATCISETVHHCLNGILVKPGDLPALSEAIITLVNAPKRAYVMGKEGRILAEDHDIQLTWSRHEKFYLEMIKHVHAQQATRQSKMLDYREIIKMLLGLKETSNR